MSRPDTAGTKTSVSKSSSRSEPDAQAEKKTEVKETPAPKKSFLDSLPPWVSTNLRSRNSWKLLARCWLASWAAVVLFIPQASLQVLGNTAFFTIMTSLFLPPSMPIQMFIFMISTLVIGVLMGWGIGCAAMRAALASRDQVLLQTTLQKVQSSAAGLANPEGLFQLQIFEGVFLDARSSVVFGCFLAIGTFIFALVRAYAPKLTFLSIFGTIAVDIFCSYGPLFPFAQYTILNSLCTSVASYMAIAIVVTIFVFPETMNHACMSATSAQLGQIKALIGLQTEVLESSPENLAPGKPLIGKISGARAAILAGQKGLMAKSGFINLEFSWGKWNGDDVRDLEEPLMALVSRVSSLQSFARLVGEPRSEAFDISKVKKHPTEESSTLPSATSSETTLPTATSNDTYLLQQIYKRQDSYETEHSLHIQDMLPVIKEATADLRTACYEGAGRVQATIDCINKRRWRTDKEEEGKAIKVFDSSFEQLQAALEAFKETNRRMLIEPYLPLLRDAHTKEARRNLPLRSLYLAYVFATNLIVVADILLAFMEKVRETVEKRKKNRLWAPKGLRAIKKLFTEDAHDEDGAFGEDRSTEKAEESVESYRRDPDSRPPTNLPQKIMNSGHHLYKWSKTAEAMFTFKYTLVSVALWLPAVFFKSAHFYYVEKGLWALIMAQTTMNIYASDQIFNYVIRLVGTFAGLCLGLACWYIGAGNGIGNHYGIAASTAVFLVPIIWIRLFSPLQYQAGVILFCATFALIVGYSWIDGHLQTVGAPGIGWTVAWKRWVLIVIGAAASFIVMMLPPTSSRKAVRLRNASAITAISEIYGYLISTWIGTQTHQKKTHAAPSDWIKDFRVKLIALADQIGAVRQMTELAKWEGSIRGKWPVEEYEQLVAAESEMITGLAQLGGALGHLEDSWRITFLHSTHVLHPNFISDVMSMFSLVSHSLRTSEPMHQVLPQTLLERLFYHRHTTLLSPNSDKKDMVDIDEMQSIDYMFYCTGLVAVYHILQSLDELHRITKRLVGEVPLKGFGVWKNEYERAHTMT